MHAVEPQIFVLSESRLNYDGIRHMLEAIGVTKSWDPGSSTPPEALIEIAGRMCYKSFEVGLNPNVTKIREGNREYIGNILKQHHGSVLEHATTTVAFIGCSRILTHELVRHRAGVAISQESMRFVRMDDIGMYVPDCIANHPNEEVRAAFTEAAQRAEDAYRHLVSVTDVDNMKTFHEKKEMTSALRRIAPGGHSTNIIVTANHRAWRHMISARTAPGTEEEIVKAFHMVANSFATLYPALYQDMIWSPDNPKGHCTFLNEKV